MKFIRTDIFDIVICEPTVHGDDRGYFVETFCEDKLEKFLGYKINFCQDNETKSKGVLRGLHYQLPPFAQTKLVRVIQGRVLDIAVDIRKGSPTFGQQVSVELSSENKRQLLVPRGFAHAFVVLEDDNSIFAYKVDNYYSPECDRGVFFRNEALGIDWQLNLNELNLSDKDRVQPRLAETDDIFEYGVNLYE
jgi:dTDP-4-dehydrorhamnose 3,5-epimerase